VSPAKTQRESLVAIASLATLIAGTDLLVNGLVYPLESARSDVGSHYELRGPYFGALDLAAGENPYRATGERPSDVMARRYGIARMDTLYAPPVLAVFVPISHLRFSRAKVVVLVTGFVCAVVAIIALSSAAAGPSSSLEPSGLAMMALLVGGSRWLHQTLALGQLNAETLLFIALGFAALRCGREEWGGCMLALAGLVKPIPLILLMGLAIGRRYRALAAAGVCLVAAYGLTAAVYGLVPLESYAATLTRASGDLNVSKDNQSLVAAILRLVMDEPHNTLWAEAPVSALTAWLLAVVIIGMSALWFTTRPHMPLLLQLATWLTVGMLISPRTWTHYFTWLLPAYAVSLWFGANRRSYGLLVAAAASYYAVHYPARSAKIAAWLLPLPPALLESASCAGVLVLFIALCLAMRAIRLERVREQCAPGTESESAVGLQA
jgi:alpha-1,2-mannosyltransferase